MALVKVTWQGKTFDRATANALKESQRLFAKPITVTQGSYSSGKYSAGTHSGPGAADLSVRGYTTGQIHRLTKILRQCGFAAWYRTSADGFSPHIHAIRCGTPGLPTVAANQVEAYRKGRNGLSGNGPDRQAWLNVKPTTWGGYLRWRKIPLSSYTALRGGVKLANLRSGKRNSDVKALQIALRKFIIARGYNADRYNPSDATGYYGSETIKMVDVVYTLISRETGNPDWATKSNKYVTAALAKRLNLPVVN